jgi:addiction module HigA family antidote
MFTNGMRPVHPGEVLREEFVEPLGLNANRLAKALHLTATRINEILREERGVSAETALRFSRFFGTTPEFWLNLQVAYELRLAAQKEARIVAEIQPFAEVV